MERLLLKHIGNGVFWPQNGIDKMNLNPKELMLYALGECAGRTALHLLGQMGIEPQDLTVETTGTLSGDEAMPNSVFTSFEEVFRLELDGKENMPKITRAVKLTHDKYCGVTIMYSKIAPVEALLMVNGQPVEM